MTNPSAKKQIRIKFNTSDPLIPYLRQTSGSKGVWNNCRFFVNDDSKEFDWWFILNNTNKTVRAYGPRDRTVLLAGEGSPDIKQYPRWFINQFGYIISSHPDIKHPRATRRHVGPWMVGHFGSGSGVDPKDFKKRFTTYDTYAKMNPPAKTKLLSVVNAMSKNRTPGQQKRNAFITALKNHFGDRMDVFGAGVNRISDKWDGIAPYKYYLMIENDYVPGYVTGIWDSYLGFTFPFYYGCPDLESYYDSDAFIRVDVNNIKESIAVIERAIAENVFEKRQDAIAKAREQSLNEQNMFAIMANFAALHEKDSPVRPSLVKIKPEPKPILNLMVKKIKKLPVFYIPARWLYRKYRAIRQFQ